MPNFMAFNAMYYYPLLLLLQNVTSVMVGPTYCIHNTYAIRIYEQEVK